MHDKYKRVICYCPICGWIDYCGIDDDYNLKREISHCHYHEQRELTLIIDRTYESIYNQVAEEHGGKIIKSNGEIAYAAKEKDIIDFVRQEYVNTEENELFDPNAYGMCLSMEEGAKIASAKQAARDSAMTIRCPHCHSSSITTEESFNTKRAVAGGLLAGITGAFIGGNTGKTVHVCKNCGHKWKPGNR